MTISEAINQVDALRPNTYTSRQKTQWLRRCEAMILKTVLRTKQDLGDFDIMAEDPAMDTPLIVPEPWCALYVHWLEAQMHYANGEYDRYNNAITMFNDNLNGYRGEIARSTPSEGARFRF